METRADMVNKVRSIIEPIPSGYVFDSHYVTAELGATEDSHDIYLKFAAPYAEGNRPTLTTHRQIGRVIDGLSDLVERMPHESWSMTIHGRGGKCALWRRI